MRNLIYYFSTLVVFSIFAIAQNFIVLSSNPSQKALAYDLGNYEKVMSDSKVLQRIEKEENFKAAIVPVGKEYALKVGPIDNTDTLTLVYIGMRKAFPQAFISNEITPKEVQKPQVKFVEKEVIIEKEDETLWIALFGLAIIGILALFLSSDQLKNLNKQHHKIQERQNEIEKKQSLLLEKMGEKIQTVALKNVNSEKKLLETHLENIDTKKIKDHIGKMKKYDEDLLRTTYEMIDFLKIKSGNIVIKEEAFQLSNMLHKLTNSVAKKLKEKEHILEYDIHHNVTRYLVGDTGRIFQVLHNLLSDILTQNVKCEVVLSVEIREEQALVFSILNKSQYLTEDEIDRLFIPTSWEEVQSTNKEFGFFVLKELIRNMDGKFLLESTKKKGTLYEVSLPYIQDVDNKSRKAELKKLLLSKKALVVDTNEQKARILIDILHSFDIEVIFKTSESLAIQRPKLEGIDFLVIKAEDITSKVFNFFKDIDKKYDIDIIVINSIYEVDNSIEITSYIADVELFSPLIIGDVEEALKQLCIQKEKKKKEVIREELEHFKILDVAKVSRKDFQRFTDKKILLVEDNLVSQQVMSSILSASQLEVHKVENGIQALHFLEEHDQIDLIFMDMDMPVMDGFEATKKIRKHYKHKDVPIVAVTGLGFNYEMEQMVLVGVNACIVKPFKVGQLYIALQRFLHQEGLNDVYVEPKVSNYKQEKTILDVTKGVQYVRSKTFYKEILSELLLALRNSDTLIKEMIQKDKRDELRVFCIDAVGLSATIGATSFVELLNQMLLDMKQDENVLLGKYIFKYQEQWVALESELRRYLKR
jgi:CheY-like chemotaxis protein/signal transduction histidine kinase